MIPNNRTIAILGMHRSGTSALTGSLEQAGLYIGDTNHHADDNIRGNRDNDAAQRSARAPQWRLGQAR